MSGISDDGKCSTLSEENDIFNEDFKGNLTFRIQTHNLELNDNQIPYRKGKRYYQGFDFNRQLNDFEDLPLQFSNEYDLFKQYYENMIKSGQLGHYVEEIRNYFDIDTTDAGCQLFGNQLIIPKFEVDKGPFIHEENFRNRTVSLLQVYKGNSENPVNRKVIAEDAIEEGQILIKEKMLLICKSPKCICSSNTYYECNYCTRLCSEFFVCETCDVFIYCSKYCQTRAHFEYHYWECKAVRHHFFAKSDSALIALRMVLLGAHHKYNINDANVYKNIDNIPYHLNLGAPLILQILRKAVAILVYLIGETRFFVWLTKEEIIPNTTPYEKYLKIGSLLVRHLVQAYSATVYIPDERFSLISENRGMFFRTPALCLCLLNLKHSCTPNAAVIFNNNVCTVKSIRAIQKDEVITINRSHLDDSFYNEGVQSYKCLCQKCVKPQSDYKGRIFNCFKCKGDMGFYAPTTWKCFKCNFEGPDETFRTNVEYAMKLLMLIVTENYQEIHILLAYLSQYNMVYKRVYSEYLFVLQKLTELYIKKGFEQKAVKYGFEFLECIDINLHKYSFQKLHIITNVINISFKRSEEKGYVTETMLNFLKYLMEKATYLCDFYMMETQLKELWLTFYQVARNVVSGGVATNDDNEEDDEEEEEDTMDVETNELKKVLMYTAKLTPYQRRYLSEEIAKTTKSGGDADRDDFDARFKDKLLYAPKYKVD